MAIELIAKISPKNDGFRGMVDGEQVIPIPVYVKTSAYTVTLDDEVILCDASAGAITITLIASSGNNGKQYTIKKTDSSSNTVTIDPDGTETIDGDSTLVIQYQNNSARIVTDGSNWSVI